MRILIGGLFFYFALSGCAFFEDEGECEKLKPVRNFHANGVQALSDANEALALVYKSARRMDNTDAQWNQYYQCLEQHGGPYGQASSGTMMADGNSTTEMTDGNSITNVQESGVDEADLVKVSADQMFVHRDSEILVLNRTTLGLQGVLKTKEYHRTNLYVVDDRKLIGDDIVHCLALECTSRYLIVIGQYKKSQTSEDPELVSPAHSVDHDYSPRYTDVLVYHLIPGEIPQLARSESVPGYVMGSRLNRGSLLTLVVRNPIYRYNAYGRKKVTKKDLQALAGSSAVHDFYKPIVDKILYSTTTVHQFNFALDLNQTKFRRASTILGAFYYIYSSPKNFYMTDYFYSRGLSQTGILKLNLEADHNQPLLSSVGFVDGSVDDSWSFKEYGDSLAVTTTTGQAWTQAGTIIRPHLNHLTILRENLQNKTLEKRSSVNDFAPTERIQSVRYINDKAYVVTFRITDPLFVIDLSNLDSPQILGELKIPGFSSYLHPYGTDRLVGVGYTERRNFVQLSLFDISDDANPRDIEQIQVGTLHSYSLAQGNHHAFYMDQQNGIMGLPMIADYNNLPENPKGLRGAQFYRLDQDRLDLIAEVSHQDMDESTEPCRYFYGVRRIFQLDGRLVTLSRYGVKIHRANNPSEVLQSIPFPQSEVKCPY